MILSTSVIPINVNLLHLVVYIDLKKVYLVPQIGGNWNAYFDTVVHTRSNLILWHGPGSKPVLLWSTKFWCDFLAIHQQLGSSKFHRITRDAPHKGSWPRILFKKVFVLTLMILSKDPLDFKSSVEDSRSYSELKTARQSCF